MKARDVPYLVHDGKLDSALEELAHAVVERRKLLRQRHGEQMKRDLKEGDEVVLIGLRPNLLNGLRAKVAEGIVPGKPDRVPVEITSVLTERRRHQYGGRLSVPWACVQKLGE